jgi:hypothetical protein
MFNQNPNPDAPTGSNPDVSGSSASSNPNNSDSLKLPTFSSEMNMEDIDLPPLDSLMPTDDDDALVLPDGMTASQDQTLQNAFPGFEPMQALHMGDSSPESDRGFAKPTSSPLAADAGAKRVWERGDREEVGAEVGDGDAKSGQSSDENKNDNDREKLLVEGKHEKTKKKLRKVAGNAAGGSENDRDSVPTTTSDRSGTATGVENNSAKKNGKNKSGKKTVSANNADNNSKKKNPFRSSNTINTTDPELENLVPMAVANKMADDLYIKATDPEHYARMQEAKRQKGKSKSKKKPPPRPVWDPVLNFAVVLDVAGKQIASIQCFDERKNIGEGTLAATKGAGSSVSSQANPNDNARNNRDTDDSKCYVSKITRKQWISE